MTTALPAATDFTSASTQGAAKTAYANQRQFLADLLGTSGLAADARAALGLGSVATQAASAVAITGGTIDGTPIGATTKAAGNFTTLACTGAFSTLDSMGFATGAGGAVTQLTSKSTGVTLNKSCGQITMNNAALGAGSKVSFTLTNSKIASTDTVVVTLNGAAIAGGSYRVWVDYVDAGGTCVIVLENYSGGSLSQAVVINFSVIKGVNS